METLSGETGVGEERRRPPRARVAKPRAGVTKAVAIAAAGLGAAILVSCRPSAASLDALPPAARAEPAGTGSPQVPTLAEREKMSRKERLRLLEALKCMPDDADVSEYHEAEETSWWGQRLDPESFWRGRVVWYDSVAEHEARRRGRGWPPIPYRDPSIDGYSDEDVRPSHLQLDSFNIGYVSSEREDAFWDKFRKSHPKPPDEITDWMQRDAYSWLRKKHLVNHDPAYAEQLGLTEGTLVRSFGSYARDARVLGYPPECVDEEAYRWAHIVQKRREYEEMEERGQLAYGVVVSNFFRGVYVDHKYITEPLSNEDIQAANAWKVAYLRRLRHEKTDESYINAYLKAWGLSSNEVFGAAR